MTKVGTIPEFDNGGNAPAESNDEVDETLEEEDGNEAEDDSQDDSEEDTDDSSTSDDDSDDDSDEDDSDDDSEDKKQKAIQGLKKTEDKIDDDIDAIKNRIVGKRLKRRTIRVFDEKYSKPEPAPKGKEDDEEDDEFDEDFNSKVKKVIEKEGYVKKDQLGQSEFNTVIQTEVDNFVKNYPEYSSKNDRGDKRWKALQSEMKLYAKPKDPTLMNALLQRCHLTLTGNVKSVFDSKKVKEANLKSASKGSGKANSKSYNPKHRVANYEEKKQELMKGGWSEKEAKEMLVD